MREVFVLGTGVDNKGMKVIKYSIFENFLII